MTAESFKYTLRYRDLIITRFSQTWLRNSVGIDKLIGMYAKCIKNCYTEVKIERERNNLFNRYFLKNIHHPYLHLKLC